MVVFFTKNNEKTYPKGRTLLQMYRVVPQTKRGNYNMCPSMVYCSSFGQCIHLGEISVLGLLMKRSPNCLQYHAIFECDQLIFFRISWQLFFLSNENTTISTANVQSQECQGFCNYLKYELIVKYLKSLDLSFLSHLL